MTKNKITIADIHNSLYYLDTEYRESLAHALMKFKYLSNSPLSLYLGSEKEKQDLKKNLNKSLKPEQIKEIITFIYDEMRGNYQYDIFKNIAYHYLDIAKNMKKINKEVR